MERADQDDRDNDKPGVEKLPEDPVNALLVAFRHEAAYGGGCAGEEIPHQGGDPLEDYLVVVVVRDGRQGREGIQDWGAGIRQNCPGDFVKEYLLGLLDDALVLIVETLPIPQAQIKPWVLSPDHSVQADRRENPCQELQPDPPEERMAEFGDEDYLKDDLDDFYSAVVPDDLVVFLVSGEEDLPVVVEVT